MLMTSYNIRVSGIDFHLIFKDNLTLIDGKSGIGKTMLFKQIINDSWVNNKNIVCLDYRDVNNGSADMILNSAKGKIIVIDNAEIVLSARQRFNISFDRDNQYIIFTHNYDRFIASPRSWANLEIDGNKGYLSYEK